MRSGMLVIGITLSLLSIVHAFIPMLPVFSVLYGIGAALALLSLLDVTKPWIVRLLAVASTAAMFMYFSGFSDLCIGSMTIGIRVAWRSKPSVC